MMHRKREYAVGWVATPAELAEKLTEHDWTGCTAFGLAWANRTLLYLNDATGPDGAQEYAVLQAIGGGAFDQVESITFSWLDSAHAENTIRSLHTATLRNYERVNPVILAAKEHQACRLCA